MTDTAQEVMEIEPPVEPQAQAVSIIQVIERAVMNPDIDVEKMERLLAMQERVLDRESMQRFNEGMNDAQKELRPVAADASNPQTKSKYASYHALDGALRPIYSRNGFSLSFGTADGAPESYVRVVCDVMHIGGYTKRYHVDMPADGKGAKGGDVMTKTHAFGAATSYGRRYLVSMIFNISVGEDNDGNNANVECISPAQKDEIIGLLKETETDTVKFLAFMRYPTIDDIQTQHFQAAINALSAKKAPK